MPNHIPLNAVPRGAIYFSQTLIEQEAMNSAELGVFYSYASQVFRDNGIVLQRFSESDLSLRHRDYCFHDSHYIPYFLQFGYAVETITGQSIVDYLEGIAPGANVIIALKDEGTQALDDATIKRLRELGILKLSRLDLYASYIWCAKKTEQGKFEVLYEACAQLELSWTGLLGGAEVNVISQGAKVGNSCAIYVKGVQMSLQQRGLNIVTFDGDGTSAHSLNFDTFATIFGNGSLFLAKSPRSSTSYLEDEILVSHAGGEIGGICYSNSKEALEHSYNHREHRVFEIDFELTSDNCLVARHDWLDYLYDHLAQSRPQGVSRDEPASFDWFINQKILGNYSPLSIDEVLRFLGERKDAYLITDTKYLDLNVVKLQFEKIVTAAKKIGPEVLNRVMPQIYNSEMFSAIESVYNFPRYVYTLYQTDDSDEKVLDFASRTPIAYVTMSCDRYNAEFVSSLNKIGVKTYIHTINDVDVAKKLLKNGVFGFYTDMFFRNEVVLEKRVMDAEKNIQVEILQKFARGFLSIEITNIDKLLSLNNMQIEKIVTSIFQEKTAPGAETALREAKLIR